MTCQHSRMRITEVNPHLLCALCGGYLIDATTIVECLHSFCKTCILRYLETSNYCPICEVLIHKKRPWQNIRPDHVLQNVVYKMVPGLFKTEMKRRREFYNNRPCTGSCESAPGTTNRVIYSPDEEFSVSLQFCSNGNPLDSPADQVKHIERRYLKCPGAFTVSHLKKFIRLKYSLPPHIKIDLHYTDEPLRDHYSLIDVAYIYSWRRQGIMKLFYAFYQTQEKKTAISVKPETNIKPEDVCSQIEDSVTMSTEVKPETCDVSQTAATVQSPGTNQTEERTEQSTERENDSVSVEPDTPCQACLCSHSDDTASKPENKMADSQRETTTTTMMTTTSNNIAKDKDDHLNNNDHHNSMDLSDSSVRMADKVADVRMEAADDEEEDIDVEEDDECDSSKQDTTADGMDVARASHSSDSATDYESSPGTDCRRLSESEHSLSWHGHHDFVSSRIHEMPKPPPEMNYLSDTSVMPLDYSQPSHVN
ncbi:polycomb complex protein BMI-1-like [Gigantopelta aegis]|uniref:polycomb complex protein BMI-1-like n=1 Tax=Gigantopelta aegis TaxID=1735272 RepID=UPI001B88D38A|nr:polycomb complex protein BMI-1-like [Gigantopelta aegis]XP_041366551.1 polycomb complex protein BMI-1-like [Gigantopelta aegis]XP_041366553.1 polycomb complex protein BMI-1-like [Gigantopelta aegis]